MCMSVNLNLMKFLGLVDMYECICDFLLVITRCFLHAISKCV